MQATRTPDSPGLLAVPRTNVQTVYPALAPALRVIVCKSALGKLLVSSLDGQKHTITHAGKTVTS